MPLPPLFALLLGCGCVRVLGRLLALEAGRGSETAVLQPNCCLSLCLCCVCVVQGVPGSPKAAVQVSVFADIGIGRGDKPGLDWYQQYGAGAVRKFNTAALLHHVEKSHLECPRNKAPVSFGAAGKTPNSRPAALLCPRQKSGLDKPAEAQRRTGPSRTTRCRATARRWLTPALCRHAH